MKRAITALAALICTSLVAGAAAAEPEAQLAGGLVSEVSVKGVGQTHYRVGPGKWLALSVTGPASLRFEVRIEGTAPDKAISAAIDLDGKIAWRSGVQPTADSDARSDTAAPVTRSSPIAVSVPDGRHTVSLSWPADAGADALVGIAGVRITSVKPPAARPPAPVAAAELALPSAAAPAAAAPAAGAPAAAKKDTRSKGDSLSLAALDAAGKDAAPKKDAKATDLALPGVDSKQAKPARPEALALPGLDAAPAPAPVPAPAPAPAPAAAAPAKEAKKEAKKDRSADLAHLDGLSKDDKKKAPIALQDSKPAAAKEAKATALANASTGAGAQAASSGSATVTSAAGTSATGTSAATRALLADKVSPLGGQNLAPAAGTAPIDPARSRGEKAIWNATVFAGAERGSERYLEGFTSVTRLGLAATRAFATHWLALASFDFRSSRQGYVIDRPSADGSARPPVFVDEQRYDGLLGIGYDYGPRLLADHRLALVPTLSFHYMGIQNNAFPTNLYGLQAGVRSTFELSPAVRLSAGIGYTFNFAVSNTQSVVGAPKGDFGMRAGLDLPLSGGYALEFGYVGDVLAFSSVYRVSHGAALGFQTSF